MEVDSPSMLDCFTHHPAAMEMEAMGHAKFHAFATTCPLPHSNIRDKQLEDSQLLEKAKLNPLLYKWISFGDIELLCVCPPTLISTESASLPIYSPKSLNGVMKPWAMLVR